MDFPSDQEIIDMYESGMSANRVAKEIGVNVNKILRILRRNKITLRYEKNGQVSPSFNTGQGGRPKIYTEEFVDNEAKILQEWMKDKNNLFIGDFCLERGYTISRIREFVTISDEFSLTYQIFNDRQMTELFKGGLKKKYAHPMCALILSHSHDIHQKTEQKLTGDVTNPLHFIIQNSDGNSKDLIDESE